MVYYDQYGAVVRPGAAPPPGPAYTDAACHTETQSFYDERGVLVRQPIKVCGR